MKKANALTFRVVVLAEGKGVEDMKVCPVCQAKAFDDAKVCFGCLHEFERQDAVLEQDDVTAGGEAIGPETEEESPDAIARPETLPEFVIRFAPVLEESGNLTWTCTVER